MEYKDYYAALDVPAERVPRRPQEGVPQARRMKPSFANEQLAAEGVVLSSRWSTRRASCAGAQTQHPGRCKVPTQPSKDFRGHSVQTGPDTTEEMAMKGQQRGNKEARKPKKAPAPAAIPVASAAVAPVQKAGPPRSLKK